jgi:hypothetical protein
MVFSKRWDLNLRSSAESQKNQGLLDKTLSSDNSINFGSYCYVNINFIRHLLSFLAPINDVNDLKENTDSRKEHRGKRVKKKEKLDDWWQHILELKQRAILKGYAASVK